MQNDAIDPVPQKPNYTDRALILGMILGAGLGTVLSVALGNPAFIGIGAGVGITIGISVGSGLDRCSSGGVAKHSDQSH